MSSTRRAIVYIDGFNLYFGLREQGWRKYYWLNISQVSTYLARDGQRVTLVKYFTSRIKGPPDKLKRQGDYLTALKTLSNVQRIEGQYRSDPILCPHCRVQIGCKDCGILAYDQHEKMTDVNIATHMFVDAMKDRMDDAILVTGDSDQRPTVDALRKVFNKRVIVCFPPRRYSKNLEDGASESFFAPEEHYRKSQFPQVVDVAGGFTVVKPDRWFKR
jgi:uncharacterized LabA/DUF88 family protein